MEYLTRMFNTPFMLWTFGQSMVFFSLTIGGLAAISGTAWLICWIIDKWRKK